MSEKYIVEFPGLPYFWGISSIVAAFLLFIFLSRELNSSCISCLSLMSSWWLIIFVIVSEFFRVNFFPQVHSFFLARIFRLAFAVLFLLFASFTVCYAILYYLCSTESPILLIWFCMYSVCSFRYMIVFLLWLLKIISIDCIGKSFYNCTFSYNC